MPYTLVFPDRKNLPIKIKVRVNMSKNRRKKRREEREREREVWCEKQTGVFSFYFECVAMLLVMVTTHVT